MQDSGALTLDHHNNKCPAFAVGYRYLTKPDRRRSRIPIPHSPRHLLAVCASCDGMKLRQALGERKHAWCLNVSFQSMLFKYSNRDNERRNRCSLTWRFPFTCLLLVFFSPPVSYSFFYPSLPRIQFYPRTEDLFLSFIRPRSLEEMLEIRLLRILLGRMSQFHLLYLLIAATWEQRPEMAEICWEVLQRFDLLEYLHVCAWCVPSVMYFSLFPSYPLTVALINAYSNEEILSLNMRYRSRELEPLLCVSWRLLDGLFKFLVQR